MLRLDTSVFGEESLVGDRTLLLNHPIREWLPKILIQFEDRGNSIGDLRGRIFDRGSLSDQFGQDRTADGVTTFRLRLNRNRYLDNPRGLHLLPASTGVTASLHRSIVADKMAALTSV